MKKKLFQNDEANISLKDKKVQVSGILSFTTVPQLRIAGDRLLAKNSELIFDFQKVTRCDSSVLALLTVWARTAEQEKKSIKFSHLPKQLFAIAKLSGLDKILPISNE